MKRFFRGFTLAEVLLSVGIIGVIAALTIPGIKLGVEKQQYGAALAKAINNLTIANKQALQDNNVRKLDDIDNERYYFTRILKDYLQFTEQGRIIKPYYNFDKTTPYTFNNDLQYLAMFTTKDGITYLRRERIQRHVKPDHPSNNYYGYAFTVYVDLNGNSKGPNALGWDLHVLQVDFKGEVVPEGGTEWSYYTTGNTGRTPLWQTQCRPGSPTNARTCTGRIVDNGYKIDYLK